MSIHRYAKRRDVGERSIVEGLRDCGFQVRQQDFPDLLVRIPRSGKIELLEVEGITQYRKRSPDQLAFLRDWQIPVVKTLDDALRALGTNLL